MIVFINSNGIVQYRLQWFLIFIKLADKTDVLFRYNFKDEFGGEKKDNTYNESVSNYFERKQPRSYIEGETSPLPATFWDN